MQCAYMYVCWEGKCCGSLLPRFRKEHGNVGRLSLVGGGTE